MSFKDKTDCNADPGLCFELPSRDTRASRSTHYMGRYPVKGKNRRSVFTVDHRGADTIFIEEESMVDRKILSVVPFLCALAWAPYAAAQVEYPTRPIRLIMPAAPGGGGDFTARLVGQKLGESLGQIVIVDNRPGADGNIGVTIVAKARPDGYTLVMSITSFPINPSLYSKR